jgi:hypothetical protein
MFRTRNLTWGALFIALGILLPMLFHGAGLGRVFLPMHIPVLLAGFFAGWPTGLLVGMVTPMLSALLTGMPPLMPPTAQMMVWELGAYGMLAGLAYRRWRLGVYPSLLLAMVGGRLVYGLLGFALLPLLGLTRIPVLFPLTAGLITGLPGLAVQLVVVPAVVYLAARHLPAVRVEQ